MIEIILRLLSTPTTSKCLHFRQEQLIKNGKKGFFSKTSYLSPFVIQSIF